MIFLSIWFFATPWTIACQGLLSMEFSRPDYWSGSVPFSSGPSQPKPGLPYCRWILYSLSHQESPRILERAAYLFSNGSSRPRNQTGVSCIQGDSLPIELPGKPHNFFSQVWLILIKILWVYIYIYIYTRSSAGKESTCNAVQFLGREDPLEKGYVTHSSILAWRSPWTISSMGSQRVGHDWVFRKEAVQDMLCDFNVTDVGMLLLLSRSSCVPLFVTPWTTVHQAPLSLRFSWQK